MRYVRAYEACQRIRQEELGEEGHLPVLRAPDLRGVWIPAPAYRARGAQRFLVARGAEVVLLPQWRVQGRTGEGQKKTLQRELDVGMSRHDLHHLQCVIV